MRQAVILAGGKGTRLAERLNGRPKPLVDVGGVPLLERQILQLNAQGISDVVLLVNHAADQIRSFLDERSSLFGRVRLIDDGEPAGTAGATLACLDELQEQFLVVYGDTLFNINIGRFVGAHLAARADATLFLHPNDHPHDSDLVELDREGRIIGFHSYPHPSGAILPNMVNAAFYAIERSALLRWRGFRSPSDFAKDLFPAMLKAGERLQGYRSFEYIKDLGTPKRLDRVVGHLESGVVQRANLTEPQACVMVDRDGTINVLHEFVRSPDELDLLPGAGEAVKMFNESEHRVAVVTNQPVIARGEVTYAGLDRIHAKLDTLLGQFGAYVDALHYCPHHPHSGYEGEVRALKIQCDCRKPALKLLKDAAAELNADLSRSWMIGDSTADILAAQKFGVYSVLVRTGFGGRDGKYEARPDFVVDDLLAAAELITEFFPRAQAKLRDVVVRARSGQLILVGGEDACIRAATASCLAALLRREGLAAESISLNRWVRMDAGGQQDRAGSTFSNDAAAALAPWLRGGAASIELPNQTDDSPKSTTPESFQLKASDILVLEGAGVLVRDWLSVREIQYVFVETSDRAQPRQSADHILNFDRGLHDH
jgi:histidinol-phosphate phosphatase family protein